MVSRPRFTFGTVILVPFPFSDQTGAKKRPAVVVSGIEYNARRRDLVILAVTSQLRSPPGFAEALLADWQSAGLVKPSALKPIFATLEQSLVIRSMGVLSADDLAALRHILSLALA
jgi:mRNA interferase MazF